MRAFAASTRCEGGPHLKLADSSGPNFEEAELLFDDSKYFAGWLFATPRLESDARCSVNIEVAPFPIFAHGLVSAVVHDNVPDFESQWNDCPALSYTGR